ncbi:MAG TPA: O-antigen ligase family protein [Oscillospiraceae bacterium]|nr:O-antigen ligase family protein [Oscillospiraceae bacterium]
MAPKTIFHTTEKSNFILNMSPVTLRKLIRRFLIICAVLPFIGGALWLVSDKNAYIGAGLLSFSGFVSILLFLVCLLKRDVLFTKNISYFIVLGIAAMAAVSAVLAYNTDVSIFGNQGRYEGLLAILSYAGLFFAGTLIADKSDVVKVFDVIIGVGIIQSIIAVFERLSLIKTGFEDLSAIALEKVFLGTGTSGSPIFFGSFITLLTGIALAGACYDKNVKRRIVYGCAAVLFIVDAYFTDSIVPLIGIPCAFLIILIFEIIKKRKSGKKSGKFITSPSGVLLLFIIAFAVIKISSLAIEGLSVYDKGIAWQDSFYKNFISGQLSYKLEGFYSHTWKETLGIIKAHPLEGTGPDCLVYPQLKEVPYNIPGSVNTFDKPYNDYLYTAATRGVASLLLYLALLFFAFKRMSKGISAFVKEKDDWYRIALFSGIAAYLVIMFFSASSIYVAPYFWLLLGFAFSKKLDAPQK